MITGRDFVITGLQPWDIAIGSNAKDIAKEIAKHNRVLYVNTPIDALTLWKNSSAPDILHRKDVIRKRNGAIRQIEANLWVLDYPFSILPCNFLPDGKIFDAVNKMNNKKMYSYLLKTIKQLKFNNYILFIDNDIYRSFYAKEFLYPILSIYYRRDNMVSHFWSRHAPRLEPLICAKSDLVMTNSIQLADAVRTYNPHCYDIGQGVDLKDYDIKNSYPLPNDMKDIKRPIIGYMGWITSLRLDADLIYNVARGLPEYSFVLVGGEDTFFKNHKAHSLHNVYFLGEKHQTETINYMAHFDVCINPQLINDITIGNYPRKIDEYLALGKPAVATSTKAMELFKDYVWNCIGTEEYKQAIRQALNANDANIIKSRIEFAHTHTWTNTVNKLYDVIEESNII